MIVPLRPRLSLVDGQGRGNGNYGNSLTVDYVHLAKHFVFAPRP